MKKNIKKIIIFCLHFSGFDFLVEKILKKKITCVGYHSVYDEKNKDRFSHYLYSNISVSSDDFEKQLLSLKNDGHTFINFSDLKNPKLKGWNRPTIIYFDDGYKDNLVNALPILKKHNIPATVFVTVGLIEKESFLWTLGLRYFLFKKNTPKAEVEKKIKELKKLSGPRRELVLKQMFAEDGFILNPNNFDIFLNWDEVKELSQNNIEIGSHGLSHKKFSELDERELVTELTDSKKIIEEKIGKKIDYLSYPYGDYNQKVVAVAGKTGYSFAVTIRDGYNSPCDATERPFELKRVNPDSNQTLNLLKGFFNK